MTIDILYDVYNVTTVIKCIHPFIVIVPTVASLLFWLFKKYLWNTKPTINTKSIVILGTKASGKTTLWNRLKGYKFSGEHKVTALDKVEKFIIEKEGKAVEIESTKDIGGDWVSEYDGIIKKGTFILFLVNATDYIDKVDTKAVRSRIQMVIIMIIDWRMLVFVSISLILINSWKSIQI